MAASKFSGYTQYSKFSTEGMAKWPDDSEETEGYLFLDKDGVVDFFPERIVLFEIPPNIKAHAAEGFQIIGTFHSHPYGCTNNKCYYQPPSVTDFNSVNTLCSRLGFCEHVIVTKDRLFIIRFIRNLDIKRFGALMKSLEKLRLKNLSVQQQEPLWVEIVNKYKDVVCMEVVPNPYKINN